jgi:hypothetical protein
VLIFKPDLIVDSSYINVLLGIFTSFPVIAFYNLYESPHFSASTMSIATLLGTLTIIDPVFAGLFFPYIVLVSLRAISRMSKYQTRAQIKLMRYLKAFSIIAYGSVTLAYLSADMIESLASNRIIHEFWFLALPQILLITGYLFFYYGYIRINNPSVLQPQKIDQFIIISDDGIPIFSYKIESEASGIDDALLSGALMAIKTVLSEATKFAGELEEIRLGGDYLMLNSQKKLTGIIFTRRPTMFLTQILSNILDEVNFILKDLKDYSGIRVETKKKLENLIKRTLTYT